MLHLPPPIKLLTPHELLSAPPETVEKLQTAQLQYPPLTVLLQAEEITNSPPPTVEVYPEAVL